MNIGGMGSAYDRTYTPYQAKKDIEDFAGYMKDEDRNRAQNTAGKIGKGFAGNFMDDQEFHKFRMSQNGANKVNFHFGTSVSVNESTEEDPVEEKEMPEEEETKTEIVVKPDGSKVLMITVTIGGQEAVTSVELSKPAKGDLPGKDISGDTDTNDTVEKLEEKVDYNERAFNADGNSAQ